MSGAHREAQVSTEGSGQRSRQGSVKELTVRSLYQGPQPRSVRRKGFSLNQEFHGMFAGP